MVRFARFAFVALVALVAFTPFSFGQYRQYAQPFAAPAQCSPGMPCYQQNPNFAVMPRAGVEEGQRQAPFANQAAQAPSPAVVRISTLYYCPGTRITSYSKPTQMTCWVGQSCTGQSCRGCGSAQNCQRGGCRAR